MIVDLGEVIATRIFEFESGSNKELVVLLGKPMQFPDSDDYYVPYQIKGSGEERIKYVGGIDSIQCLQLVMKVIGAEVMRLVSVSGHTILWDGDDNGGIGFPT